MEAWLTSLPSSVSGVTQTGQNMILSLIGRIISRGNTALQKSLLENYINMIGNLFYFNEGFYHLNNT